MPGDYLASGSSDENVLVFKTNFVPPTSSISEPPAGGVRSHSDLSDLRQSASVAASLERERERERERPPIDNTNSYDFSGMPGAGTLPTCFTTRTKVQILTSEELRARRHGARVERRERAQAQCVSAERRGDVSARQRGTHFTCFTSTEVPILTPEPLQRSTAGGAGGGVAIAWSENAPFGDFAKSVPPYGGARHPPMSGMPNLAAAAAQQHMLPTEAHSHTREVIAGV